MSQQTTQFDLTTPSGVLAYLAPTPFASAKAEPLSGGNTNFIFRLHLNTPHHESGRPTLILKHTRPFAASAPDFLLPVSRQDFEVEALRRVRGTSSAGLSSQPPPPSLDHAGAATATATVTVTVPAVYLFDSTHHVIVMDDAGPRSLPLKAALLLRDHQDQDSIMTMAIPPPRAAALGTALGAFLRALHARGRADAELRDAFEASKNRFACEISAWATYDRLGATLRALDRSEEDDDDDDSSSSSSTGGGSRRNDQMRLRSVLGDEPLGVPEDTLRVVEALAEKRAAQMREGRVGDTFLMGDFWPGNVLVGGEDVVLVVDWEVAKVGSAGLDVGQFCAELATLRRLRPERAQAADEVLKNFVRAYFAGDVGPEADETRRVAVAHFGVHLAVWTPRTGWDGGVGPTRALMLDGVARMVEGADADRIWTDEEIIRQFLL
ncbi:kinase-like domain-containing protein [Russula compacta]|nr:kinase-like domain-containing protein [Russula compacta]